MYFCPERSLVKSISKLLRLYFIISQSFAQKLTGLVAGPQDGPQDDTPWYLRYGARGLGIVAAFCK